MVDMIHSLSSVEFFLGGGETQRTFYNEKCVSLKIQFWHAFLNNDIRVLEPLSFPLLFSLPWACGIRSAHALKPSSHPGQGICCLWWPHSSRHSQPLDIRSFWSAGHQILSSESVLWTLLRRPLAQETSWRWLVLLAFPGLTSAWSACYILSAITSSI